MVVDNLVYLAHCGSQFTYVRVVVYLQLCIVSVCGVGFLCELFAVSLECTCGNERRRQPVVCDRHCLYFQVLLVACL